MTIQVGNAKVWDGTEFIDAVGGGVPQAVVTTATGEAFAGADGDFEAYIWKANGTIVVGTGGLIDYLVVGGGGSGAARLVGAGGGGAGEVVSNIFQTNKTFFLPAGTYDVTVGAGGASVNTNVPGLPGTDSSIGSVLVARRGGGGGTQRDGNYIVGNMVGGSGGGAGTGVDAGGVVSQPGVTQASGSLTRFGNRGGENNSATGRTGGGGGGANAIGANGGSAAGGGGGAGKAVNIISSSLATAQAVGEVSGSDVFFGGGGSGGQASGTLAGGIGGGGAGGAGTGPTAGSNGDANTGGGGGGQSQANNSISGAGGSGVVIIRVGA